MQDKKKTEPIKEELSGVEMEQSADDAVSLKTKELENKYRRALADYQNLEKRVSEEKGDWIKSANRQLLLRLLPSLDTLMLASQHTEDAGIKATAAQFLSALQAEGIEKVVTENQDFDPSSMEVIQTQEGEEGRVLQELRSGYTLYGKLLRPAQVIVGAKGE